LPGAGSGGAIVRQMQNRCFSMTAFGMALHEDIEKKCPFLPFGGDHSPNVQKLTRCVLARTRH
jgi:hypothetical protein